MNYDALVQSIVTLHQEALGRAAFAVNRALVLRNWVIGAYLIEFEQNGADRAAYGTGLLSRLSLDLRQHDVKGVSPDVLERMRLLYLHYPQLRVHISAPASRNLPVSAELGHSSPISATPSRKSGATTPTPLTAEPLLQLSWSHLVELDRLDDPWKRAFYENECLKGNWSVRQLQRQIGSILYERTGLVVRQARCYRDSARSVFRGARGHCRSDSRPLRARVHRIGERPHYRESELEGALLDHLQLSTMVQ